MNHPLSASLVTSLFATLSMSGCTLNVNPIEREVNALSDTAFTGLALDLTAPNDALDSVDLSITGATRDDAQATGRIVGLRGSGESEDALLSGWGLAWAPVGVSGGIQLLITTPPDTLEVWMDSLTLSVPRDRDVVVGLGSHSAHLSDLNGRVQVLSTSGSMHVATTGVVELTSSSGSMVVTASSGTLTSTSGDMVLDLSGWVNGSTVSGSVVGNIGDGGSLDTTSGSIDIALTAALTRDLLIDTVSGSVVVRVPRGARMSLDLSTGSGGLSVDVEGVRHDGDQLVADVAGGGPLLSIHTESGSIIVRDAN